MRLTEELVALVERLEPDPGPEPGTREHNNAEYAQMVAALLVGYQPEELWVFAYGSLIWKPAFTAAEHRRATAYGWHRSFCMELVRFRGTREQPGLMMALDGFPPELSAKLWVGPNTSYVWGLVEVTGLFENGGNWGAGGTLHQHLQIEKVTVLEQKS